MRKLKETPLLPKQRRFLLWLFLHYEQVVGKNAFLPGKNTFKDHVELMLERNTYFKEIQETQLNAYRKVYGKEYGKWVENEKRKFLPDVDADDEFFTTNSF